MIKENELRIGNMLHHKKAWSYRQGNQILEEFDFTWNSSDWGAICECTLFFEDIDPIELSEQRLLEFGFEKKDNKSHNEHYLKASEYSIAHDLCIWYEKKVENDSIYTVYYTKEIGFFVERHHLSYDEYECDIEKIPINSVHELQNHYFATTKKEL